LVWLRKTLTAGESDPENAPCYGIGLPVADCFSVESAFGNRISRIVCDIFSCGTREAEEKIVSAALNVFLSTKKSPLCIADDH
jgi:hypothetical protein